MNIPSYPKVYNLGHPAIKDLFDGTVQIEEKVDGSQISFGVINGQLEMRSRRQKIEPEDPTGMFANAVETCKAIEKDMGPNLVYRGEYLQKPKHNTLCYDRVPDGHIIIWDICTLNGTHCSPEAREDLASDLGLETVPVYEANITELGALDKLLENTSVLGGQLIEGVVIKNYGKFGEDGKYLVGKYVSERFRELHKGNMQHKRGKGDIITQLAGKYSTEARWEKAIQHLKEAGQLEGAHRDIGPLMKELHRDFHEECGDQVKEELWDFVKKELMRRIVAGFPEFYKKRLAEKQFE